MCTIHRGCSIENSLWLVYEKGITLVPTPSLVLASLSPVQQDNQFVEHLLGIFSSLLRLLPAESAGRIRTLAKFVEKDYEKIEKLIKLRRDYASKLSSVERKIEEEQKKMDRDEQEAMGDEWLSRRLDAGLFSL